MDGSDPERVHKFVSGELINVARRLFNRPKRRYPAKTSLGTHDVFVASLNTGMIVIANDRNHRIRA